MHDGWQFKFLSLYRDLKNWDILQEQKELFKKYNLYSKLNCRIFLILFKFIYRHWNILKNFNKKRYNTNMNSWKVVIENAFDTLEAYGRSSKNSTWKYIKLLRL